MRDWKCLKCGKVIGKRRPRTLSFEKCFCNDCRKELEAAEGGILGFFTSSYDKAFDELYPSTSINTSEVTSIQDAITELNKLW